MDIPDFPATCYIAGAMTKVPPERQEELSAKRKAIAKFFQDAYSITCSHYGVLTAQPEDSNPPEEELQSIVARDLELVCSADPFVLCFEGKSIYAWGTGIELGYAYSFDKKPIVIFNLSEGEDESFLIKHLQTHERKEVNLIKDESTLRDFTKKNLYKKPSAIDNVEKALKELEKALFSTDFRKKEQEEQAERKRQTEELRKYIKQKYDLEPNVPIQKPHREEPEPDLKRRYMSEENQFIFCYEDHKAFTWEAAIDLGYYYGKGTEIVVFNLSEEKDIYFFIRLLPRDDDHQVWVINDQESLSEFEKVHPQPPQQKKSKPEF